MPDKISDKPQMAVIYLNRRCPRRCPYCNAWRAKDTPMSVDQWKETFQILRDYGCNFYLILGNEPLLLGNDLVELVQFWKAEDYYYAIYSTSPQPYFDDLKDDLITAGLRNWSAGVDFIPEVYEAEKERLSPSTHQLVKKSHGTLVKKATESLAGLRYMYDHGVKEVLALITVSRMNIEFVPEMIVWLNEHLIHSHPKEFHDRWKVAFNYVEYGDLDNDFALEQQEGYFFTENDRPLWKRLITEMRSISERYPSIQIPYDYLLGWEAALQLNHRWKFTSEHLCIEHDGQLRKCGYRVGKHIRNYTVFDLPTKEKEILHALQQDVDECKGCYWALPFMLDREFDYVRFDSEFWSQKYETV